MTPEVAHSAMGAFIRDRRIERGETQDQFADRIGIGQTTLSAIELGDRVGTLDTRRRIAAGLGMTLPELIAASGDTGRYIEELAELTGIEVKELMKMMRGEPVIHE